MSRYLKAAEKEGQVREWLAYRESQEIPEDAGGLGYPDPEIFGLTDKLNAIDGVCTVQSCAGHRGIQKGSDGSDVEWVHVGQLWLRLNRSMSHWFYELAFAWKAASNQIIQTAIWNQEYNREVIDIRFKGLEVSQLDFARSSEEILEFLWQMRFLLGSWPSSSRTTKTSTNVLIGKTSLGCGRRA